MKILYFKRGCTKNNPTSHEVTQFLTCEMLKMRGPTKIYRLLEGIYEKFRRWGVWFCENFVNFQLFRPVSSPLILNVMSLISRFYKIHRT